MKLLAVFLLFLIALIAPAQTLVFDAHVANIKILLSKPIQHEIGITEAQRKRMNVFADKYTRDRAKYYEELRKKNHPKLDQRRLARYENELKVGVLSQMSPAQVRRLRELTLQVEQVMALTDPVVVEYIKADKAQIKKLRQIFANGTGQIQQIGGQAENAVVAKYRGIQPKDKADAQRLQQQFSQEMRQAQQRVGPQLKAIADRDTAEMLAVLTPQQKAAWTKLQGRKFSFQK